MAGTILVVDDDPVQRRLTEAALSRGGHAVETAEGGAAALEALAKSPDRFGAVLLDLVMPGGPDGIAVMRAMRERGLKLPVIVQTAQGGIDTAVGAMREGAFDFVVKPASPDKLNAALGRALKVEAFEGEARRREARGSAAPALTFDELATTSAAMDRALRLGRKAAASDIPILLEGESGTGKEVMARAIQAASRRANRPFVTVNCGAIPDNLVESILFGHEKGAFTGATERHTGKFVEAHGGTLFLDEIGDLPADVQVKLLRAVQEGEVDPVGGKSTVKVDIRLISATHRDLARRVREGRFREDLYYRLHVFPIALPALRERRGDVPALAARFIARAAHAMNSNRALALSPEASTLLEAYDWPGNIRQLENAISRAVVLAEGDRLTEAEFPQIRAQVSGALEHEVAALEPSGATTNGVSAPDPVMALRGTLHALDNDGHVRGLAAVELDMIRLAIDHYGGQMSEVARRLGIGRSTLYRKLKEYGLDEGAEGENRAAS
ncbi:MAG: sigma-54-dependent Fis family transcriptional regulator [Methylobacterium mesophilicum]|nr:sigma-54-dependent Fis family transcriptional regulator [Methylobacterium mesophilicum]